MRFRTLLALVVTLIAISSASGQDETANSPLARFFYGIDLTTQGVADMQAGKAWSGTLDIFWWHDPGGVKPVKYRLSWTVNQQWLSHEKANPSHNRRGNLFFTGGQDNYSHGLAVTVPKDKTLRLRVRLIYPDKSRAECTISKTWAELLAAGQNTLPEPYAAGFGLCG